MKEGSTWKPLQQQKHQEALVVEQGKRNQTREEIAEKVAQGKGKKCGKGGEEGDDNEEEEDLAWVSSLLTYVGSRARKGNSRTHVLGHEELRRGELGKGQNTNGQEYILQSKAVNESRKGLSQPLHQQRWLRNYLNGHA